MLLFCSSCCVGCARLNRGYLQLVTADSTHTLCKEDIENVNQRVINDRCWFESDINRCSAFLASPPSSDYERIWCCAVRRVYRSEEFSLLRVKEWMKGVGVILERLMRVVSIHWSDTNLLVCAADSVRAGGRYKMQPALTTELQSAAEAPVTRVPVHLPSSHCGAR